MKARRQVAKYGKRGGSWVRVFLERGHELVRVQYRERAGGPLRTESWSNTAANQAEARAWADGLWSRLSTGGAPAPTALTLRDLWERYSRAEFPHLRPRSRTLYHENYRRWAVMFGWEFVAERTTPEMADEFRAALTTHGLAPSTIKKSIDDVKRVFAWAESRDLLQRNRLRLYRFKIAKEDRAVPPAEYRGTEFEAILKQLDPRKASQWRAWAVLTLCGLQGARQNAVLHLQPEDVTANTITWRARWDKLGKAWTQPLRARSAEAIAVALQWRQAAGYEGPWLFFPASRKNRGETYSPQSLWGALERAEKNAGIAKQKRRGAHGFRRMLAGDVAAITGDAFLGLRSIGDTDPRMATRYVQDRDERMSAAFTKLDEQTATETQSTNGNGGVSASETPPQPSLERVQPC